VATEQSQDVLVQEGLHALGVAFLCDWDALAFLHRHSPSLATAAQLAPLIGYDKAEIGVALHRLATLGLIQRSRVSQGIRIYRYTEPPEPGRHACLRSLMSLAQNRTGRLLLLKHLKHLLPGPRRRRNSGLRLA